MSDKPRILVLGGVGMIGRNFVKYCIDRNICSYIRVADKTMPEIAYLRSVSLKVLLVVKLTASLIVHFTRLHLMMTVYNLFKLI